jgi:hypothetical protein
VGTKPSQQESVNYRLTAELRMLTTEIFPCCIISILTAFNIHPQLAKIIHFYRTFWYKHTILSALSFVVSTFTPYPSYVLIVTPFRYKNKLFVQSVDGK